MADPAALLMVYVATRNEGTVGNLMSTVPSSILVNACRRIWELAPSISRADDGYDECPVLDDLRDMLGFRFRETRSRR